MRHTDPARLFQPFRIRRMERREMDLAVQWAAEEGWNPGLHDADAFYAADPNSFLLGVLDGEPAGCISAVRYGDDFGFLGFYIVQPQFRGKGFGIQLWRAGMNYLAGRNVGLDGVVAQQSNYGKSGFRLAYRNVRYAGTVSGAAPIKGVVELSALPFEDLVAYDRQLFPAERREFLREWISLPGSTALAALEGKRISGCGVIRPCRSGYKIGPLFADDEGTAERLFSALASHASAGVPLFLDVPEPNEAAVAMARRHGMEPAFETARMYNRELPPIPLERIFGVTSFELG